MHPRATLLTTLALQGLMDPETGDRKSYWQAKDQEARSRSVSPVGTQSLGRPASVRSASDVDHHQRHHSGGVPDLVAPPLLFITKAPEHVEKISEISAISASQAASQKLDYPPESKSDEDDAPQAPRVDFYEPLQLCLSVAQEESTYAKKAFDSFRKVADGAVEQVERIRSQNAFAHKLSTTALNVYKDTMDVQIENELNLLNDRFRSLAKFTVVCFGRTMAGKSTFIEYVRKGDGSTIGIGKQNTTTENKDYSWEGLTIVDTPGIGSFEDTSGTSGSSAHAFRAKALEGVARADVVLFVLSNDSIQEDLFRGIEHIFKENKPVIFALNVKSSVTDEMDREFFLEEPQECYKNVDGHKERLWRLTESKLGVLRPKVFEIHGQAAFLSTQTAKFRKQECRRLLEASKVLELLTALASEVREYGRVRRLQTMLDGAIGAAEKFISTFTDLGDSFGGVTDAFGESITTFERNISTFHQTELQKLKAAVGKAYDGLKNKVEDFVHEHVEDKNIGIEWEKRVKEEGIPAKIQQEESRALDRAQTLVRDLEYGLNSYLSASQAAFAKLNAAGLSAADATDHAQNLNIASAVFGGVNGVIFASVAIFGLSNAWNPLGWAALGISVILGAVGAIWAWMTGGREKKLRQAREKASNHIHEQIKKNQEQDISHLTKWLEQTLIKSLRDIVANMRQAEQLVGNMAKINNRAKADLREIVERLNMRLVKRAWDLIKTENEDALELETVERTRGKSITGKLKSHSSLRRRAAEVSERLTEALREKVVIQ